MGKWDKVIDYLNTTKAEPDKVLNSLKTIYSQTKNSSSAYHTLRSSWPIDVVWNIYNKTGTKNKNKKNLPTTEVIRNWVKSPDYDIAYRMFHPGPGNDMYDLPGQDDLMKIKLYKKLPTEKHIKYVLEKYKECPMVCAYRSLVDKPLPKKMEAVHSRLLSLATAA